MQALLTSFSDDLHIIILRIGLRLAQLEQFSSDLSKEQRKVVQETLELYVPLADQLGMGILRARLEDVSFRLMEPSIYAELDQKLKPILAGDALCLDLLKEGIQRLLKRNGVKSTIHGRTKGLYSLYRKMCCQQSSLEAIMDRIGLRIIVTSVQECYHVLGLLHTHFRPIPGTFDDYIGLPKASGYQSLHTCIYPVPHMSHKPVEIQIRTDVMHREAEFGIAAHWRYKTKEQTNLSNALQLKWFRNLQLQHKKMTTHMEFLEHFRNQVFESNLVVFGNAGQQVWLLAGVTVRDFAEQCGMPTHSRMIASINGKVRAMDYPLRDGDTVELTEQV